MTQQQQPLGQPAVAGAAPEEQHEIAVAGADGELAVADLGAGQVGVVAAAGVDLLTCLKQTYCGCEQRTCATR